MCMSHHWFQRYRRFGKFAVHHSNLSLKRMIKLYLANNIIGRKSKLCKYKKMGRGECYTRGLEVHAG